MLFQKKDLTYGFDNMVIPKTAQNKEGAYKFMNFLMLKIINKIQNGSDMLHQIKRRQLLPKEVRDDHRFILPKKSNHD